MKLYLQIDMNQDNGSDQTKQAYQLENFVSIFFSEIELSLV